MAKMEDENSGNGDGNSLVHLFLDGHMWKKKVLHDEYDMNIYVSSIESPNMISNLLGYWAGLPISMPFKLHSFCGFFMWREEGKK